MLLELLKKTQLFTVHYLPTYSLFSGLSETETTRDMLSRGPMRGQLFQKAKVKSLQMTAVIVAAFIICWTPYYVVFIVFTFSNPSDINERSSMWIFFFGMANSMVNPLIYGAFHVCKRRKRWVIHLSKM